MKRRAREPSPEYSPSKPSGSTVNAVANAQAPKECPRSGHAGKRRKRKATQEVTQEVAPEVAANPPQESQKYVDVQMPAAPSLEILSRTSGWLAKIASSHISDTESWVEEVSNLMNGLEWASQTEALADDSLLHVAQRCQRAETISSGANFVKIMAELFFAAKVNGYSFSLFIPYICLITLTGFYSTTPSPSSFPKELNVWKNDGKSFELALVRPCKVYPITVYRIVPLSIGTAQDLAGLDLQLQVVLYPKHLTI